MFNLIMGGTQEYFDHWPMYIKESGNCDFPISRMLENTPDEIRQKLTPLNNKALAYIEKLPTLFMSELYQREGRNYITIRVGLISNLKVNNKNIDFNFRITNQPDEILVNNKNLFLEILELGAFGLNRTHWGIKNGYISTTLKKLGINYNEIPSPQIEDIPESSEAYEHIDSVESFMASVLKQKHNDDDEIFYRGHSDASYELAPSLFRKNKNGNYRYLHGESSLVREALTARPNEFMTDNTMLDKLVRMQHYGLPTRLLDITSNPLIALYFACSNIKYDEHDKEIDGHVIIFKTKRDKIKFFDSDTVSCISNLSMLNHYSKEHLNCNLSKESFNTSDSCLKLLHHIKDEKPYFKDVIIPTDLERIIFVKGRVSNERMSSQSGAFLIFGNNAVYPDLISDIDSNIEKEFKVERIIIKGKDKILKELARLNITDATVYQGMERTLKLIADKFAND